MTLSWQGWNMDEATLEAEVERGVRQAFKLPPPFRTGRPFVVDLGELLGLSPGESQRRQLGTWELAIVKVDVKRGRVILERLPCGT